MELILISNTKLKIMLNESDMQKYRIGSESDCAEISTRKAIRTLLECARDQIGFNTDGEEIFVQLYTSKGGGCELFVTKCLSGAAAGEVTEKIKSPVASNDTARTKSAQKHSNLPSLPEDKNQTAAIPEKSEKKLPQIREDRRSRIAFSFRGLSEMLAVCRILNSTDLVTDSRAFKDEDGAFYLLLLNTGMSAFSRLDKLTFIQEYGKRENPDCLISYISEHGKVICPQNAVETLGIL